MRDQKHQRDRRSRLSALADCRVTHAQGNGRRHLLRPESWGSARHVRLCKGWRRMEAGIYHEHAGNVTARRLRSGKTKKGNSRAPERVRLLPPPPLLALPRPVPKGPIMVSKAHKLVKCKKYAQYARWAKTKAGPIGSREGSKPD